MDSIIMANEGHIESLVYLMFIENLSFNTNSSCWWLKFCLNISAHPCSLLHGSFLLRVKPPFTYPLPWKRYRMSPTLNWPWRSKVIDIRQYLALSTCIVKNAKTNVKQSILPGNCGIFWTIPSTGQHWNTNVPLENDSWIQSQRNITS